MRANKILNYESILQVLDQTGCPFCRFMKTFQAELLQDQNVEDIHHLCNFHSWDLAASPQAIFAAGLFPDLLTRESDASPASACDICVLLLLEENRRIRDFIGCAHQKPVEQWMRSDAVLCIIHGTKLTNSASSVLATTIKAIVEKYREHLIEELTCLRDEYQPDSARWGYWDMRRSLWFRNANCTYRERSQYADCRKSYKSFHLSK